MSLFDLFYDGVDMSACVPAGEAVGVLNRRAAADGLHYPLCADAAQPVGELVLGLPFTSRSFRYGAMADNVLGMRFTLPSGQPVDVGGRVVKNVTGFELTRFLVNSGRHFGAPERVVLRLRPLAEVCRVLRCTGSFERLQDFARAFLRTSWVHVVDACDACFTGTDVAYFLEFRANAEGVAVFEKALRAVADASGVEIAPVPELPIPPATATVRLKTVISKAAPAAQMLVGRFGGRAHLFAGNAYLLYVPEADAEKRPGFLQTLGELHNEACDLGGHLETPLLAPDHADWDRRWCQELYQKWKKLD